jgi:hypothetical protein
MKDNFATYRIETQEKEFTFESNIPVTILQSFLRRESNRFNYQRFVSYVETFKHIKKYFVNLIEQ